MDRFKKRVLKSRGSIKPTINGKITGNTNNYSTESKVIAVEEHTSSVISNIDSKA